MVVGGSVGRSLHIVVNSGKVKANEDDLSELRGRDKQKEKPTAGCIQIQIQVSHSSDLCIH